MTGPKYRRYHCTPRSGIPSPRPGTPESCGTPIEPPEEPRPQPWEWTGGMYQCTDTNSSRNCNSTFDRGVIPTRGYSRFEVTYEIGVIAHDNDPSEMQARVDLTLRSGGSTDQFIEEMQPRSTRGLETRPWRGTLTVPNNGEPIFTIRTRVDEATTRTYFSIRAIP
jgi:hypothetical protein